MNYSDRLLRETASYSVLDVLLADIAVRIQLSPSDYERRWRIIRPSTNGSTAKTACFMVVCSFAIRKAAS